MTQLIWLRICFSCWQNLFPRCSKTVEQITRRRCLIFKLCDCVFRRKLSNVTYFHKFNCMLLYLVFVCICPCIFEYIPCIWSSFVFLSCGLLEMVRYKGLSYVWFVSLHKLYCRISWYNMEIAESIKVSFQKQQ